MYHLESIFQFKFINITIFQGVDLSSLRARFLDFKHNFNNRLKPEILAQQVVCCYTYVDKTQTGILLIFYQSICEFVLLQL
jgi:hypothetical protein